MPNSFRLNLLILKLAVHLKISEFITPRLFSNVSGAIFSS